MSIFPARILLATDGSEHARLAVRTAVDMSKKLDSELHVVYVEPIPDAYATPGWGGFEADLPTGVRQHVEEEARTKLEEELRHIREAGGEVAEAHVREGRPGAEIVRLAEELDIGLIVLGSRGLGGVKRALIGSVSDSVVRHAHCPVLVVRK